MTETNALVQRKPYIPIENGQLKPQDFEGLYRVADIMAQSGMVPTSYRNNPAMVFVAVQMGMEIGLSPMMAVQNIAVINGNPCLWGDAVLAVVSGSDLMDDMEETTEGNFPDDNFKCICRVVRKGRKTPIIREYSIADAKQAGLFGSSKDNWKKHPKRMLQMRARSHALRDGFPDLLKGIKVREEVMDYDIDMSVNNDGQYVEKEKVFENLKKKEDPKQEVPKQDSKPKKEAVKQEISDDLKKQVMDTVSVCEKTSKNALIDIGRDSISSINTDELATAYLKKFSELLG